MWMRIRSIDQASLFRGLCLFVVAGSLLYLAALLWSGWDAAREAFSMLGWGCLFVAAFVSSISYLFRFVRWHSCLGLFGYHVPAGRSFAIYLSGLALTTSPGKLGETLRSVLLLQDKVPVAQSLGMFLADRLSDVFAVCILMVLAGLVAGHIEWLGMAVLATLLTGSFIFRRIVLHPELGRGWAWLVRRSRFWHHGREILESWGRLWSPVRVAGFVVLAVIAYGVQALVFSALCARLDMHLSVAQSIGIFCKATLFGAASMVPGGLGAMEASLVWQLTAQGVGQASAVAVAIAVRMVTLWFGIALGLSALSGLTRRPSDKAEVVASRL